jgi:glutamyl-Q tRNA(Asp) synthetase
MMPPPHSTQYIGRFAPSPTGPLHFGSLLAALASFLDARAHNGQWLLRIEDIDPPREATGAATAILDCLRAHGLQWDGDVLYQSERISLYREVCARLVEQHRAFYCTCSRLDLANSDGIYTGRCRRVFSKPLSGFSQSSPCAVRLRVDDIDIRVDDRIQRTLIENIARDVGDFVIYRKEDLPAYQLAVVIDDAVQNITHIVRGSDLLASTARQIFLQRVLRYPTPQYAHIPVIANTQHQKLSKQTLARELDNHAAAENLLAALAFLQQPPPPATASNSIIRILQWAVDHWDVASIPRKIELCGDDLPPQCRRFAS